MAVRLKHMDDLELNVKVLWPAPLPGASGRPPRGGGRGLQELQSLAGRHLAAGQGRPTLSLRLPLQTMAEALDQLRFAHAHGSVGVFMQQHRERTSAPRSLLLPALRRRE